MIATHIYDQDSNLLYLSEGGEIKLDFDVTRFTSPFSAQAALQGWARAAGIIRMQDEVAFLV